MAVSASFRSFVLDQLGRAAPAIRAKNMFGGVGIYSNDCFFALIDDDQLYLKVDDANRPDFENRGMGPFRPYGPEEETMGYYALPEDVLEDVESLTAWVDKAVAAARRKRGRPRKKP